jgi:hypothetical protein
MKKLMISCVVLMSAAAFAGEMKAAAPAAAPAAAKPAETAKPADTMAKPADAAMANPMAQWKAPKVTKEDKKGVDDMYKAMEENMKKGDVEASAAMIDFPVLMVTDSSAGATMADMYDRAKWVATMKPAMENMPKDAKWTNKHKAEFLSDNLASVIEEHTMTMGKVKSTWKSHSLLVKKDGKWMQKSMTEGGWGDMMGAKATMAPAATTETKAAMK